MKKIFTLLLSFFILTAAFAQTKQKSKPVAAPKKHTTSAPNKVTAKKKSPTGKQSTASKTKKLPSKKPVAKPLPPIVVKSDSISNPPVVDNLLTILTHELGKPYRFGSIGPTGFDCSGLIKFAFSFIGIALPRTAADIGQLGEKIALNDLHPGDLLFFSGRRPSNSCIGHVGCVYKVDSDKVYMIHSSKEGVNITDINSEYYRKRLIYARRIFTPDTCKIAPKSKG